MSVLHAPPASSSDSQNSGTEYRPLTLRLADIAATLTMAASRIRASISQYQSEAANTDDPSAARIMHFKAGLQWEITLFPQLAWNIVPDHVFSSHLCSGDPSRIISSYDTPWWIGHTAIPNELWQWDRVFACCIRHYQHWLSGIEDDGLVLPEQVDETSGPTLLALKWMREHLSDIG
ncbi:hypothetical protein EDB19DRAFT_1834647 [Suillus lakei]|nr:hypothetical protein EDB19DRAFT_1834647 [Suillus lakei]